MIVQSKLLVGCGVVAGLICAGIAYVLYPQLTSPLRNLPSPPRLHWLLGHLHGMGRTSHTQFSQWVQKYGSTIFLSLGSWPALLLTDVNLVKSISITHFKSFPDRPFAFRPSVRVRHLLWAEEQYWRFVRGAINPVFTKKNLNLFCEQMTTSAQHLVERLDGYAEKSEYVNMHQFLGEMTMEVIAGTAFGVDLSDERAQEFSAAAQRLLRARGYGISFSSLLRFLFPSLAELLTYVPPLTSNSRQLYACLKVIDKFGQDQILARRTNPEMQGRPGFLQMLLNIKDPETNRELSDAEVVEQCRLFMLAGYDTTANALTFALYLLSRHPDVENRMVEEIFNHDTDNLNLDTLQEFKFVEAVIEETLRLYPTGSSISRQAVEDSYIGDLKIKKGTVVIVPLYAFHRRADLFPEPDEFRPDRFLPGSDIAPTDKYAWSPFGQGPRMCIGYRFAMAEAMIALITLYKRFSFELSPDVPDPLPVVNAVTLSPTCPVNLKPILRE